MVIVLYCLYTVKCEYSEYYEGGMMVGRSSWVDEEILRLTLLTTRLRLPVQPTVQRQEHHGCAVTHQE
jgi:hypothetical protein